MTLLDATTTLIAAVKTWAPEEDRKVAQAVKRMEKRLFLLQVRHAKARKRNRTNAFWDAMTQFHGGACQTKHQACIPCKACGFKIFFGDFCKHGDWTGHGKIKTLGCPKCGCTMQSAADCPRNLRTPLAT